MLSIAGDALRMLFETPSSENTRRAYRDDIADFLRSLGESEVNAAAVELVLGMDAQRMTVTLRGYVSHLRRRSLAESTIKRRLASVKKLIGEARLLGATCPDPNLLVKSERIQDYRDVAGPELAEAAQILDSIDRSTSKGKRDYALILLLVTNGLRRGEIVGCDVRDFDRRTGRLHILGKGRAQREWIQLLPETIAATGEYLGTRADLSADAPLIATCDRRDGDAETRLTGRGFYDVVREYGKAILGRSISPHKFRHTAITEALEATNGNIPKTQDFSRHARPETVMLYRHAVLNGQGEINALLGERLSKVRAKKSDSAE